MLRRSAAGLLFCLCLCSAASESRAQGSQASWPAPQTDSFRTDWDAVRSTLPAIPLPQANADRLGELTSIAAEIFPGIYRSPVPVLAPFALADYAHDRAADSVQATDAYSSDFQLTKFFLAGPTGYDAAFVLRPREVAGLGDIGFRDPVVVQISAFNMLYRLPAARGAKILPSGEIEQDFPGIRRQILEHTLRYSFERYGVPYVVTIQCYDSPQRRTRLSCRNAERIADRFLHALQLVGGNPAAQSVTRPPAPISRPEAESKEFSYHPVGKLIPGTGMRAPAGDPDQTVYARIRFPTTVAPAYVTTQVYRKRDKSKPPSAEGEAALDAYRWRDNFCERRDFQVGQCPSGRGHQGQDIRGLTCHAKVDSKIRCRPNNDALVAVREGMVQREAWNESFFLVVNAAGERMRFRHLHMHPRQLDGNNIISGETVKEGQPIGAIGNYDRRPGLTSTHLHFELQVPTRDGFVRVNPYMTLIAAYEQLIGARGTEYVPRPEPEPDIAVETPVPQVSLGDHVAPAVVAVAAAAAAAKVATAGATEAAPEAASKSDSVEKNARAKNKRKAASRKAKSRPFFPRKRRAS